MKKLFLAALAFVAFSCSKDAATTTPVASEALYYFKAKLNGTSFDYTQNNTLMPTHAAVVSSGYVGNGFDHSHYYSCMMMPYPTPDNYYPRLEISFDHMYMSDSQDTGETEAFYGLFDPVPTNFITDTQDNNFIKGISCGYIKSDGTYYTTKKGDQTGSSMTVTSSVSGTNGAYKTKTIKGTITCKLYNEMDPSDVITLTNGTYKLYFQEYN